MRRLLLWIIITFVLLVIATVITAIVVLRTDVPRRMVLEVLREETGLNVNAASLETGWAGRTIIRDLSVGLPLESDPFLTVDELAVDHTALIRLVLTRRLVIDSAEVRRPDLTIEPDERGEWNILRAAEIITQVQAERPPDPAALDTLPRLRIADANVHIAGPDGTRHTYDPITIEGDPIGVMAWGFSVEYAQAIHVEGRIAPRAGWQHQVAFDVDQIRGLIEPWLPDAPDRLAVKGTWRGSVRDAALDGTLEFDYLIADRFEASGESGIYLVDDQLTIRPRNLHIRTGDERLDHVGIIGGSIVTDGHAVAINRLAVTSRDTTAQITGGWSRETESGQIRVNWSGSEPELLPAHEGMLEAHLELPDIGRKTISATMRMTAEIMHGEVDSHLTFEAAGREWTDMKGSLRADRLYWEDDDDVLDLTGLTARFESKWPQLTLTRLHLPDTTFRGRGNWNVGEQTWALDVNARDWTVPTRYRDFETGAVDLELRAYGTKNRMDLHTLRLVREGIALAAKGYYVPGDDQPLHMDATVDAPLDAFNRVFTSGSAQLNLTVRGSVEPIDLALDGVLNVENVALNDRVLEPISASWTGRATGDQLTVDDADFAMLDGSWKATGAFDLYTRDLRLNLQGDRACLARLVELAELPVDLSGSIDADVELKIFALDVNQLHTEGVWSLSDFHGPTITGARGEGQITARGTDVSLHDMLLVHNDGHLAGQAHIHLDSPDAAWIGVQCENWKLDLPELGLAGLINGMLALELDLAAMEAYGDVNAAIDIAMDGRAIGQFDLVGTAEGRTLVVERMTANLFDGHASGSGQIVVAKDRWHDSEIELAWSDLDLTHLAMHWPAADELRGVSSGELHMRRATEARPPEPMHLVTNVHFADAWFGPMEIESVSLDGYLGPRRIMIAPVTIDAAQGRANLWTRVTLHNGEPYLHVNAEYDALNLEQVVHVFDVTDEPMPGRISGAISGGGYLAETPRMFGRGHAELSQSELVALPGFRALYDLLNLDFAIAEPTGHGMAEMRLEGNAVEISRLSYFNRGSDIIARLRIDNLWEGRSSTITGLAAGTIRPLRDFDLPLIGNLDRLIAAIQTGAASVRIAGTLEEPDVSVVPFAEVFEAVGRIIRGTPGD